MENDILFSALRKLSLFENLDFQGKDQNLLRGTSFWEKRSSITALALSKKPAYRTWKLLEKVAPQYGLTIEDWREFVAFATDFITDDDYKSPVVYRFKKRYGNLKTQRVLLTTSGLFDLYIMRKSHD